MPDREPRYRFWGSQKPIAFTPVAEATTKAGAAASMRLYGPVDSWGAPFGVSANEFSDALDALGDVQSIELHMHSPGGEVFEGLAIRNMLAQHPAKVTVVVDSLAASIASVICTGADEVVMAPGAQVMVHDAAGICVGNAGDMATMQAALESVSSNIADLYAAHAGGTAADWRAAMQPESWFKAHEAVDAGFADRVLAADEAPPQPTARFDLSIFAHAGRDDAPQPFIPAASAAPKTPADPPVTPPTETEADTMSDTLLDGLRKQLGQADTMSDTLLDGLRKQLGLADDADEATVLAANAEALAEKADPPPAATPLDTTAIAAALAADGKVVVSQNVLDELKAGAQAGAQARAKQLGEERDEAISAAFRAGKISAERREAWKASWDKDPEGTKADLESLPARFPTAKVEGYQGHDGAAGESVKPFTDDEADSLGALAGLPKGALR